MLSLGSVAYSMDGKLLDKFAANFQLLPGATGGFPSAASGNETLMGKLGSSLAAIVDSEIRFPALNEFTARVAARLTWRERTWCIAVERGGWVHVEEPCFDELERLSGAA